MKRFFLLLLLVGIVIPFEVFAEQPPQTQDTAEGVAVLMAKAFIDGTNCFETYLE